MKQYVPVLSDEEFELDTTSRKVFENRSLSLNLKSGIYVRVSTDEQTLENQIHVLEEFARRRGFEIVQVYSDHDFRSRGLKSRNSRVA